MLGIADYPSFVVAVIVFLMIPGPGNLALITSTGKGGLRGGLAAIVPSRRPASSGSPSPKSHRPVGTVYTAYAQPIHACGRYYKKRPAYCAIAFPLRYKVTAGILFA